MLAKRPSRTGNDLATNGKGDCPRRGRARIEHENEITGYFGRHAAFPKRLAATS
jgi:hypothetical protein